MAAASLERSVPVVSDPPESGLGPGRFVIVVGPSGAGKDSLIRAARERFAGDEHFVFPSRWITRPPSASEDNVEITQAAFDELRSEGRFAAFWTAHGLGYGLPADIDESILEGRTVICNVSRRVVPDLRARYANTLVVEVTASLDVLAQRLAGRGRKEDGPLRERLDRSLGGGTELGPDVVIRNECDLALAAKAFLELLA